MMSPGEVYFADVDDSGLHPAIVVSRDELNRGDYVVCVLCTSAGFEQRRHHPSSVPFFAGEFGFTKDCVARCDTVITLRKLNVTSIRDQSASSTRSDCGTSFERLVT